MKNEKSVIGDEKQTLLVVRRKMGETRQEKGKFCEIGDAEGYYGRLKGNQQN